MKQNFIAIFVSLCERAINHSSADGDDDDDDSNTTPTGATVGDDPSHRNASEQRRNARLHAYAEYVWRNRYGRTTSEEAEVAEATE